MKGFLKKWAEKLSNFKFLARIMMCLSACAAVVALLGFVAFQLSGGVNETGTRVAAFGAQKEERQLVGMFFFLVLAAVLVLGIVVVYQSKDYAFPKTKMAPNKTLPVICVANSILSFIAAVFSVLAVVLDHSIIPAFWYVLAVLFVIVSLANLTMLLPALKSHYFMPKLDEGK